MNKYPICIVSKDRADTCTTHKLLDYDGIKYYYMVEPQDYNDYEKRFGSERVINIGENDKGIYYVRNFCIGWCRGRGFSHHWQTDDDLRSLFFRPMNRERGLRDREKIESPVKMLSYIEDVSKEVINFGAGCLTHDGFAFSKKRDIDINKMIYCFQLINNDIITRFEPNISVDVDFSVSLLKEGYITMVFNTFSFTTPPSGKEKGGCNSSSDYKNQGLISGRKIRNINLCQKYPQWFFEYTKNGKSEIKPSKIWRTFKQVPMTKKSKLGNE